MTFKKTLSLIFVMWILSASGQISVESFRLLETDLTAITHGTQEIDQNGEVAALIKIVTTQRGFTFDGGMLGIVKTVLRPAEYWVYVPRKLQKITIAHPDLGILRDYYFQMPIEGGRTYELILLTGQAGTSGGKTRSTQYLTLKVTPANATVYVDDELQTLNSEGAFFKLMTIGTHSYRVEAAGYRRETGTVELGREKVTLSIALKSSKSTLTITCNDAEADIVLNEEVKGKKSWTGTVLPGLYVAEARRFGYYTSFEEIEIRELEDKTVVLEEPVPICGSLRIESDPMGASVYIDDKYFDETPCRIDESAGLLVGEHYVKVLKDGYNAYSTTVIIQAEEEMVLSDICLIPDNKTKRHGEKAKKDRKNIAVPKEGKKADDSALEHTTKDDSDTHEVTLLKEDKPEQFIDGHEYVDLALPSERLWGTCNIGATTASDFGYYFAWGEAKPKEDYSWSSYEDNSDNLGQNFSKYNTNANSIVRVVESTDDAATVNWGSHWQTPKYEDWFELIELCEWKWTYQNDHAGYIITGLNGNSIFLPAAGFKEGKEINQAGSLGFYWSSSLHEDTTGHAWGVFFDQSGRFQYYHDRYLGRSIRPVCRR